MGLFAIVMILVWATVIGGYLLLTRGLRGNDADRIKNRLLGTSKQKKKSKSAPTAALIQNPDADTHKVLVKLLKKYKLNELIQQTIEQAGLKWTLGKFTQFSMIGAAAGYAIPWYFLPSQYRSVALFGVLLGAAFPYLYLKSKKRSRLHKFEEQFPDSLEFVARSMRAGHAFSVSLEMIHNEFAEPLGGEFRRTFDEHNLGLPLDVALEKLAERIPLLDVHFFVSAVLLQKRTGGNLAEILDKLAFVIRERFKLRGKIRAISAHGRMTGTSLTCIPIAVAILMFYTNPDYVRFFFNDEIGNYMLGAAVALQLIGYGIIQKIVKIEV